LLSRVITRALKSTYDEWRKDALCAQVGGDFWFPEQGGSPREAKMICKNCPVSVECLEYAMAHDERYGIWGGYTERERRRLKRIRRKMGRK